METLLAVCKCGHQLGHFAAFDDHGGVNMKCLQCTAIVHIPNGLICEMLDNPDDYEPNDRFVAEPAD